MIGVCLPLKRAELLVRRGVKKRKQSVRVSCTVAPTVVSLRPWSTFSLQDEACTRGHLCLYFSFLDLPFLGFHTQLETRDVHLLMNGIAKYYVRLYVGSR